MRKGATAAIPPEAVCGHRAIHFYRRNHQSNRAIVQFLVELKRLAATCSFATFLQKALRDHVIEGYGATPSDAGLLALPDDEVTWDRVCNVATGI
ncbi:hypothetical protein MTO96_051517 [Rhipicephalus appendiculatus]